MYASGPTFPAQKSSLSGSWPTLTCRRKQSGRSWTTSSGFEKNCSWFKTPWRKWKVSDPPPLYQEFPSDQYRAVLHCVLTYITCDRPKEAFMGGHPFLEIPCILCSNPVNLVSDLSADENGKAVHEECYVKRITGSSSNSAAAIIAD